MSDQRLIVLHADAIAMAAGFLLLAGFFLFMCRSRVCCRSRHRMQTRFEARSRASHASLAVKHNRSQAVQVSHCLHMSTMLLIRKMLIDTSLRGDDHLTLSLTLKMQGATGAQTRK